MPPKPSPTCSGLLLALSAKQVVYEILALDNYSQQKLINTLTQKTETAHVQTDAMLVGALLGGGGAWTVVGSGDGGVRVFTVCQLLQCT